MKGGRTTMWKRHRGSTLHRESEAEEDLPKGGRMLRIGKKYKKEGKSRGSIRIGEAVHCLTSGEEGEKAKLRKIERRDGSNILSIRARRRQS